VYIGQFKAGDKEGYGIRRWADGEVRYGLYMDDEYEGYGYVRFKNNKEVHGRWQDGELTGEIWCKDGGRVEKRLYQEGMETVIEVIQ